MNSLSKGTVLSIGDTFTLSQLILATHLPTDTMYRVSDEADCRSLLRFDGVWPIAGNRENEVLVNCAHFTVMVEDSPGVWHEDTSEIVQLEPASLSTVYKFFGS